MKPIKMLGLTMVVAIASMALFGTASASAIGFPELCKVKGQTPCESGNKIALPVQIHTELQSEQAVLSGEFAISCQKSKVNGEATGTNETETEVEEEVGSGKKEKIKQIVGKIKEVTWEECSGPFGSSCTAMAIQLPWTAHLNQKQPVGGVIEQNNGDFFVGEPNGEQPGALIKCKTILGSAECTFKVEEEQPGEKGEWAKLQFKGAQPAEGEKPKEQAKFIAKEVQLKLTARAGSNPGLCGPAPIARGAGKWTAEYKATEPNEGMVDLTHEP